MSYNSNNIINLTTAPSTETEMSSEEQSCMQFDFIICVLVIGIACLLGVIGNTTSVFVLWKHKTDSATIFLLQCLSIADSVLLITTLAVYTFPQLYLQGDNIEEKQAKLQYVNTLFIWPVAMMSHTATIWLTVLVSINRYCSICKAFTRGQTNAMKSSQLQVALVVVLSILYNIPRFFEHQPIQSSSSSSPTSSLTTNTTADGDYNNESSSTDLTSTTTILGDNKLYQIIYSNIMYFGVMYIFPLISLGVLNWKLIKALNDIRKRKESLTGHKPPEDHITLCIIAIVFVFLLCQTPALVNQIFWAAGEHSDRACGRFHFYYTKISDLLVVINSSMNFVIYCLFGKSFRQIFCDVLCQNSCTQKVNSGYAATQCKTVTVPMENV